MPLDQQRLPAEPLVNPYRRHLRLGKPPGDAHLPPRYRQPLRAAADPHHYPVACAGEPVACVLAEPQQPRIGRIQPDLPACGSEQLTCSRGAEHGG